MEDEQYIIKHVVFAFENKTYVTYQNIDIFHKVFLVIISNI